MSKSKKYFVGLEREALRLNPDGSISLTPHPESLGDKLTHPYITTDFSESQLELVTPPFSNNKDSLKFLNEILSHIRFKEPNIILHNHSLPPNSFAKPANFGKRGKDKNDYREYLLKKYGLEMQLISGIHYNFSIEGLSDEDYLHIIRNTIRYGYILPYLFGKSGNHTSIRSSSKGYFPPCQQKIPVDLNSTCGYKTSLRGEREYYLFIKPKFKNGKIAYIESRSLDIDPSLPAGITIESMEFMKEFFFKMLELPSPKMEREEFFSCIRFHDLICLEGLLHSEKIKETLETLQLSLPNSKPPIEYPAKLSPVIQQATDDSIFASLECSTRLMITEAKSWGLNVSIVDRKTNTIKIDNTLITKATLTEKDSHISYLLQKDKALTKQILIEAGLNTPKTFDYAPKGVEVCIKPLNANYGQGITIKPTNIAKAMEDALLFSDSILIEEYVEGEEYRFFVIDGKEVFVCKRNPPVLLGDGTSTISELIEQGNALRDPDFFIQYDGDGTIILNKDEKFTLRKNSNVSTGGMAIDCTERMPEYFKKVARDAAYAMKSFLCGVDIIIKDLNEPSSYAIIETNYNPALYLHEHPLFGGRKVSRSILSALGLLGRSDESINHLLVGEAIGSKCLQK